MNQRNKLAVTSILILLLTFGLIIFASIKVSDKQTVKDSNWQELSSRVIVLENDKPSIDVEIKYLKEDVKKLLEVQPVTNMFDESVIVEQVVHRLADYKPLADCITWQNDEGITLECKRK